jgi:hypothetical protein
VIDHEYDLLLGGKKCFGWTWWTLYRAYRKPSFLYPVSIHFTKKGALQAREFAETNRYLAEGGIVTPA